MSTNLPRTNQSGLAKRRLGVIHLVFFTVAASAPLTVLGGGITTAYLVTGIVGTPISFIVLAVVLAIFAVGYAAMSRYVSNAGAFYSYLANGISRTVGVAGSFVALTAYNAINFGLYGLFGAVLHDFMSEKLDINIGWWVWSLVALAVVGILGVLRVDLNATVLAILLLLECTVVTIFDVVSFAHPQGGSVSFAPLDPSNLFVTGFGAVMAMAIACFSGFESAAIYSEEAKDPRRTVARATYVAVAFTGAFYALSAWGLSVVHGPENVQGVVAEQSAGAVFGPLGQYAGTLVADLANVLFITSVFAALLSFHNSVARYLFALGRERVMPKFLGRTGIKSAAPVAGSVVQTLAALIVVVLFTVTNRDPVADLFTWLSGVAAVGLVLLMTGTSVSVVGYFRRRQTDESVWRRAIAPTLAAILLAAVLFFLVFNFDALLAPTNPSYLKWLLPGLVGVAGVVGLIWGVALRSTRPDVYAGIGRSAVQPLSEEEEYVPVGV